MPDAEHLEIAIIDDHPVYRDGMRLLIGSFPHMHVVGTAADGEAAIALVDETQPDVVIMDVQMPVRDGISATREIVARHPHIAVIVLTMSEDDETVFAALRAGARGYLLKGASQTEISQAIDMVAAGGLVFGANVARLIGEFFAAGPTPSVPQESFPQLTPREYEILNLLAAGRSNATIAQALFLSPKTVRNNTSNIFAKLHVADRAEAIVRARDSGLGRL